MGFPEDSDSKNSICNAGDLGSIPGLGRSPWEAFFPLNTPVFLPGKSQGQRSLGGYRPWGHKESDLTKWLTLSLSETSIVLLRGEKAFAGGDGCFPGGSDCEESACNAGDLGLIPGLGRSPGGGHGNPLQCSCLENPHGQRSLAGYSPWGQKESDMTEQLSTVRYSIYGLKNMKLVQEVKTNRQMEWI